MPQLTPSFFFNPLLFNFFMLFIIIYVFANYLLPRFVRLFKTRLYKINNLYCFYINGLYKSNIPNDKNIPYKATNEILFSTDRVLNNTKYSSNEDSVCKVFNGGLVLNALLYKANRSELYKSEIDFVQNVAYKAFKYGRETNLLENRDNYVQYRTISDILARDFYSELTTLIIRTTKDDPKTYDDIVNYIYNIINNDNVSIFFRLNTMRAGYYPNRISQYRDLMDLLEEVIKKHAKDKLIDASMDDMANYYFNLWTKNFSILEQDRDFIFGAYNRYIQVRLERDKVCTEFLLDLEGRAEYMKSWFFPKIKWITRDYSYDAGTFKPRYSEQLDEFKVAEVKYYENYYLAWLEKEKYESMMKPLLDLQKKNLIDPTLNLKDIKFTTLEEYLSPITDIINLGVANRSLLEMQEIETIASTLAAAGII